MVNSMEEKNKIETVAESATPTPEAKVKAPVVNSKPAEHRGDYRPRREGGRPNRRHEEAKEFEERVVNINRVSKTVKGGRHIRFAALVVIGDGKGRYGYGTGKAGEVPDAIKKAQEAARRNMFKITLSKGDTLSHEIIGKFGACNVYLKPAPEGTGIIAGGPVRAILELAGVKNVYSKVYGSRAPINVIRATNDGLAHMKSYRQVKILRGKE